jgi:hypothetical protein
MRHLPSLASFAARSCLLLLAAFSGASCTVTQDGIQKFEVPIEEILPPSRVVASYRQLAKPSAIKDAELEEQFGGGKERLESVDKWSKGTSIYADYGIPERPPKARISVTEMSTKQNAYGAYTSVRPAHLDEKSYVKIGVHGTVMEDRLLFVQDRFLIIVRDLSGSQDPERRTMLINFGHAISDRMPRDITDIALVGYLPYENRVPASEKLDKDDPLGMGLFKNGGVTALFRIEQRDCHVFLADIKDHGSSKGVYKDVKKALEKEGKTEDVALGEEAFTATFRGSPGIVARRESVVYGCYGAYTDKEMKALMSNIDRRIKPYVPPKIKDKKDDLDDAEKKRSKAGGR